jgi:ABC-type transport system involved in multi-copper enzyme maturation permease subunit
MTLFGPVLPYDLVRVARRGRYIMLRAVFALVLLGLLYLSYRSYGRGLESGWGDPKELAKFAEHFFHLFLLTQFVMVYILTPAYVGDAIAEEKQRGTLDYLLTTHLSAREIVLGKLMSRLANVVLFLLVGLPILSMTQLFGGVSFDLIWGGFAALFVTLLSVGAVSIFLSVHSKTPRDAIMLTFLLIICYFVGWIVFSMAANKLRPMSGAWPMVAIFAGFARTAYDAGNPFMAFFELQGQLSPTTTYGDLIPPLLLKYAFFHGAVTFLCVAFSVNRLRTAFRAHRFATASSPSFEAPTETKFGKKPRKSRTIGNAPMVWKETHVGRRLRIGWLGKSLAVLLALACLAPGVFVILQHWLQPLRPNTGYGTLSFYSPFDTLAFEMNQYIRFFGTLLCCVLLLAVGVRAAGTVGVERDKQTLDGLLASPLTVGEIIFAKWWGSLVAMRGLIILIGVIWFMGVATGGLQIIAVPLLAFILAVYMIFMASLGSFFAVCTTQTLRAVMGTLMTAMFFGGGPWVCVWLLSSFNPQGWIYWLALPLVGILLLVYAAILTGLVLISALWAKEALSQRLGPGMATFLVCACPPVLFVVVLAIIGTAWHSSQVTEYIATGLTPPGVLSFFAFSGVYGDTFFQALQTSAVTTPYCVVGIFLYGVAGCFLGLAARDRFQRTCGRIDTKEAAPSRPPAVTGQLVTSWGP